RVAAVGLALGDVRSTAGEAGLPVRSTVKINNHRTPARTILSPSGLLSRRYSEFPRGSGRFLPSHPHPPGQGEGSPPVDPDETPDPAAPRVRSTATPTLIALS